MKKTRYIPYGYTIRNGRTIIDQTEAEVIRRIFDEYIGGASLQEIADHLTMQKIPYTEKTAEWGKAKVARIIQNTKYIGHGEYDPIIKEDTFKTAGECKTARQKNTIGRSCPALAIIRSRVRCAECGKEMIRTTSNACRIRESWTCTNTECKMTVRISDGDLLEKITLLMNRIIENSDLMMPNPKENCDNDPTIYRLQNELQREYEKPNPSEEFILDRIRKIATAQYEANNSSEILTARLARQRVSMMSIQETFNADYFADLIQIICLERNSRVRLITKTVTEISEEEAND